jgi:hypothetical protein
MSCLLSVSEPIHFWTVSHFSWLVPPSRYLAWIKRGQPLRVWRGSWLRPKGFREVSRCKFRFKSDEITVSHLLVKDSSKRLSRLTYSLSQNTYSHTYFRSNLKWTFWLNYLFDRRFLYFWCISFFRNCLYGLYEFFLRQTWSLTQTL